VAAYGAVDELNAFLGRALGGLRVPATRARLAAVQHDLFSLGAQLAAPSAKIGRRRPELPPLPEFRIAEMERWMDEADARLPTLRAFILPGGSPGAAELHLCRTVCRRAEREIVSLVLDGDEDAAAAVRYMNRLSDLLFVFARLENAEADVPEVQWEKGIE
jgi:cob(I)alamin adenosyltransferase